MVLAESPRCPLSGAVIQLGGLHLLLCSSMGSMGTVVAGKGTDASSMCTPISHLSEIIIYAKNTAVLIVDRRACAKGIRVYL